MKHQGAGSAAPPTCALPASGLLDSVSTAGLGGVEEEEEKEEEERKRCKSPSLLHLAVEPTVDTVGCDDRTITMPAGLLAHLTDCVTSQSFRELARHQRAHRV
nr:unnamed protein product [Spirometra erinaceieuropaei]